MPKLRILSDLHLEALSYPEAFNPAPPDFDILVVAGDVVQGQCEAACRTVARLAAGKPAIFVLGNHEYWNGEVRATAAEAGRAAKRHNVVLLDNDEADIDGVRFVGGTMWGDFANADRA